MRDKTHDEAMAAVFRDDPAYAVALLNSIREDGASPQSQEELQIALRQLRAAFGDALNYTKLCAIAELESGSGTIFASIDDLMDDLRQGD